MILLLLFPLLITVASGVQLIEHFECGNSFFTRSGARYLIGGCHAAVQDDTNLCCKEHDLCYELQMLRNYTRDYCDARFCNCLQDVTDRAKDYYCTGIMHNFCGKVIDYGEGSFEQAVPVPKVDEEKFALFEDARPLGLDMQRLVDACGYAKGIAVHCHNRVYYCLEEKHERYRRLDVVTHSYEDCRSTIHDCMQMVIDNEPNSNCSAVARDIAKQANTYMELEECKHGRSIIETYPIVAARLIKQCNESHIEPCLLGFHDCAENNRSEHPELLNAARKIKIGCHQELRTCIDAVTVNETSEDCIEARNLAVGLIRDKNLERWKRSIRAGRGYLAAIDGPRR